MVTLCGSIPFADTDNVFRFLGNYSSISSPHFWLPEEDAASDTATCDVDGVVLVIVGRSVRSLNRFLAAVADRATWTAEAFVRTFNVVDTATLISVVRIIVGETPHTPAATASRRGLWKVADTPENAVRRAMDKLFVILLLSLFRTKRFIQSFLHHNGFDAAETRTRQITQTFAIETESHYSQYMNNRSVSSARRAQSMLLQDFLDFRRKCTGIWKKDTIK